MKQTNDGSARVRKVGKRQRMIKCGEVERIKAQWQNGGANLPSFAPTDNHIAESKSAVPDRDIKAFET